MSRPASALVVLSCALALLVPTATPAAARSGATAPQRMIVLLAGTAAGTAARTDGVLPGPTATSRAPRPGQVSAQVRGLARQVGFRPDHVFRTAVQGFSARLTSAQVAALRADPAVAAVIPDQPLELTGTSGRGTDRTASGGVVSTKGDGVQHLPTGLRRIHADQDPIAAIGGDGGRVDADVAILDSGIARHPDLDIAGGINCTDTGGPDAWGDAMGHGTHVAGIIGALDNGIGVVGVAPGVRLWSVKIIGDDDHGFVSWAVCGLDWVASAKDAAGQARFEAANMSVGGELLYPDTPCGTGTGDVYHQAVCRVIAAGIPVVVAAGNNSADADDYRPSAYDEAITVSALADFDGLPGSDGVQADICPWYAVDHDDTFANFSDFGPAVDLIAPGKCIFSTFTGGRYAWMSGTSMATPHVTGAVILYRQRYPDASPAAVEAALRIAGTTAWVTRTDPDGRPDPLLDVSRFLPPPTFTVDATDPAGFLGANGTITAHVAITRSNGQTAPIAISGPRLPEGLTVEPVAFRGDTGTITLHAQGLTSSGPLDVTVRAADGVSSRAVRIHLEVDAKPPAVEIAAPLDGTDAGTLILADPELALDWTATDDGGSTLGTVRLAQVSGPIPTPGSCGAVVEGSSVTLEAVPGPQAAAVGACTQWVLTARDGAGNRTVRRSAPVIVDASAPGPLAVESVDGDGAWAAPGSALVWVRPDATGPLTVTLHADDPESGLAAIQSDDSALGDGWALAPVASAAADTLVLDRAPGLVDSHVSVSAVNGAGRTGAPMTLTLVVDRTAPTAPAWQQPLAGARPVTAAGPVLAWSPGTDAGSGIAPVVLVGRQEAPASTAGDCVEVDFGPVSELRPLETGTAVTDVADATCYRFVALALDRVGNRSLPVTSGAVLVDATAPVIAVSGPQPETLAMDTTGTVAVTWTAADAEGSGVARAWLQRLSAPIAQPGICPDAGYTAETAKNVATSPHQDAGLAGGRCYRWTVGARDVAGNLAVITTGTVLVDTSAPDAPAVTVHGQDITWDTVAATAWFRADVAGTAALDASASDAESDVAALLARSPRASGWAAIPAEAPGASVAIQVAWTAGAAARDVTVAARDRAGLQGEGTTIHLRPDAEGPAVAFTWPTADLTVKPGDVTVAWTEHDTASGVDGGSRSVRSELAPVNADGTCAGVTWSAPEDAASAGRSLTETLRDGTCRRWTVSVADRLGHRSTLLSPVVLVDGTPPVVADPAVTLRSTQLDATGRVPLRLRWTMRDADGEAVRAAARHSRDDGATWTAIPLADRARPVAELAVDPVTGLRLAVRAEDASGNRSGWQEASAVDVVVVEDADPAITWSGAWHGATVATASGGHLRWSSTAGATATVTVHGRAVAWVTRTAPNGGTAIVSVDGVEVGHVDLRRRASTDRRIVSELRWPDAGDHTITLTVDDAHAGRVTVDAFIVLD